MLTMRVLRLNELGLGDDEAINAHSAAEILQVLDNNAEDNENIPVIDELRWKEDFSKQNRRILEWWSSLIVLSNGKWLPYFEKMLVAMCFLHQPSSAIVERAFSQINYIRFLRGCNLKEDDIELRAMLRCNSKCDTCEN